MSGAGAMVAHLKLLIAKLKHDRFGTPSERGRKLLDQLERTRRRLIRTGKGCLPALAPSAASRCAGSCRRICRVSA